MKEGVNWTGPMGPFCGGGLDFRHFSNSNEKHDTALRKRGLGCCGTHRHSGDNHNREQ